MLSQFCIFTVFRVISWTMPSAVPFGRVTQSPMRNMSFAESCTPDTNPKILSLNTNISTVAAAPNPAKSVTGDLSISVATIKMPPRKNSTTWSTCTSPRMGWFFLISFEL